MLLAVSMMMTVRFQPENEVAAYKKFLREHGEKLEISEVLPPPVPPESNSVAAVEEAFRLFGSSYAKLPDAMKMIAPGKALVGWRQPDARGDDFTNSWDDFSADMAADQPAIELLHQVLKRPRLDFQLDYKNGFSLLVPQLVPLRRSAQVLMGATVCDLHNGDTGAATTNILTLLELVQKNEAEGVLISHLVRIAMTAIVVVPTWELLQATNVTDAQLDAVQQGWEQMDLISDAEHAFEMERAWGLNEVQKSRASHEEFQKLFGPATFGVAYGGSSSGGTWPFDLEALTEKPRYALAEVMWRSSWSYTDELRMLQSEQIILEALRAMQTNRSQFYKADYDAMTTRLSASGVTNVGEAFFQALKIPDLSGLFSSGGLGRAVERMIQVEAAGHLTVAAIALKRFQLQHGKWPETLGELVPEFISAMPIDPYDGKSLRYHPNVDGTYLLYSIGDDGVDDGGNPTNAASGSSSLYWQRARDWVWPQPATPAEVQSFYEHPPK